MKSRLTGKERSLFEFVQEREKLFCQFCKGRYEVEQSEGMNNLLSCGHVVVREISVSLEEEHKWRLRFGYPKMSGGWWMPPEAEYDIYPGPTEMLERVKMMPALVGEIRKVMGKEWNPA